VKQYLRRTVESVEESKYGMNGILNAPIRIHYQASIARPDVADGNADTKFTPASLSDGRVDQPFADERELEFAHGALQPEKEPVVRQSGIVNAVAVDDVSSRQPAKLEQVMPITTIARQPRSVQTEDRANGVLAYTTDQIAKAGPGRRSASPTFAFGRRNRSRRLVNCSPFAT
jgi:hypothetical protein